MTTIIAVVAAMFAGGSAVTATVNSDRALETAPWIAVLVTGLFALVGWMAYLALRWKLTGTIVGIASAIVISIGLSMFALGVFQVHRSSLCDRANAHLETGKNYSATDENRAFSEFSAALGSCVDGRAFLYMGQSDFALHRYSQAIDDLTAAIPALQGDGTRLRDAYLKRGQSYLALQDCDLAVADLKWSVRVDERWGPAYHNLALARAARAYSVTAPPIEALPDINMAVQLSPDGTEYLLARGKIYLALGNPAAARNDLTAAAEATEDDKGAVLARAEAQGLVRALANNSPTGALFPPCRSGP